MNDDPFKFHTETPGSGMFKILSQERMPRNEAERKALREAIRAAGGNVQKLIQLQSNWKNFGRIGAAGKNPSNIFDFVEE